MWLDLPHPRRVNNYQVIWLTDMSLDLEKMKGDIEAHLNQLALPIFYAYSRLVGTHTPVYWDVDRYPDFRAFIECGKQCGARVYVFHHHAFTLDQIHEALDTLEDSDLSREEKRSFEVRLRELQAYEGFTCALELRL